MAAGFKQLILGGFLFALLYLPLSYGALPQEYQVLCSCVLWILALVYGYLLLIRGFDYYRIRFSFTLSFILLVVFLYELVVLLTGATGILYAIALFLAPYLGVGLFGALREKLESKRTRVAAERAKVAFTRKLKAVAYQLDSTMWFFMVFGFVYLTLFMLIPILLVLVQAFTPPAGGSWWSNFYSVLRSRQYVNFNPIYANPLEVLSLPDGTCTIVLRGVNYGPVLNSLVVASIVTLASTVIGVAIAYVLARYRFLGHSLLRVLATVPLFNTPFINAYVVKLLWSEPGPFSMITRLLTGCYLRVESLVGVAISQVLTFYPIVYLNAYTAFLNVDPSTEEQAENLGAHGFKLFRTVTLPLALPGVVAGSILVFVFSLEDLGAPMVFNERYLMSFKIYDGIMTAHGTISPEVAALGVVLLLLSLVSFIAVRNYVSMRTYAMISRGGRWSFRAKTPGIGGLLAVYLVIFPLVVFAMLPQVGVVLISLGVMKPYPRENRLVLELPQNPLEYLGRMFLDPAVFRYISNTLVYASVSLIIAVFLAICVGYSVSRLKIKYIPSLLDALATSPLAVPGLVFALGYYIMFTSLARVLPPEIGVRISPASIAFEAWVVFIVAFSVRRLPYVVRSVFAGFQQIHENLEEMAMNLGASRYRVVFGVILPYIIGYVVSGALIGFVYMATEVSTSITFGGIRQDQAPITYYMQQYFAGTAGEGPYLVAAMGTLLILIQLIAVILVVYVFKQRYAFIGV